MNLIIGLMCILLSCGSSLIEDEDQEQHVEQPDLKNMVLIPAGEFLMGSPEGEGAYDEHPQHVVYLDDYYIDKYEVTNAQFKNFVEATGYVTDAERKGYGEVYNPTQKGGTHSLHNIGGVNWRNPNAWILHTGYTLQYPSAWKYYLMDHPVVQVSWNDAQMYAKWAGKRLPTEAEWVGDWYAPNYYASSPENNPRGPKTGKFRVIRGGSWKYVKSYQVLSANRAYQSPDYGSNFVGFRCAWSESPINQK